MGEGLSEPALARLSEFVATHLGLHFPRERWRDLERGIVAAANEFEFRNANPCIEWLTTSPLTKKQIEVLASHLTVGETYFFRDRKSFQLLEDHILPHLIQSRREADRRLRIWSAGCATGEEAYSVAMLLSRLLPDLKSWNVTILATDINPRFLQKASEGVYGQWSFRECPPFIQEACFEKLGEGKFRVLPRTRKLVEFAYLNLAEDAYPSLLTNTNAMDVVFCRNVLMYFAFEQARRTAKKLHRCLVEGGWLLVSPSETSHLLFSEFATVSFPGAILYRKDTRRTAPAVWAPDEEVEHLEVGTPLADEPLAAPEPVALLIEERTPPIPAEAVEGPANEPARSPYENALALYSRGSYDEAVRTLQTWLGGNPTDADAMALLARSYANQGRVDEARAWCERAIAADRLRAAFHYLRAAILLEQGDEAEAAVALRRSLYLDQDFILSHLALGNLRRRQGKRERSRKHFESALSLLRQRRPEEPVPEAEGMTSGRLMEIIQAAV